jgi:hypothetical protein
MDNKDLAIWSMWRLLQWQSDAMELQHPVNIFRWQIRWAKHSFASLCPHTNRSNLITHKKENNCSKVLRNSIKKGWLAKGAFKQKTCKVSFEHTHIKERGKNNNQRAYRGQSHWFSFRVRLCILGGSIFERELAGPYASPFIIQYLVIKPFSHLGLLRGGGWGCAT